MVLIAAAICTKGGKALVSRQFVEMTKSRIEGLLAAFPKLMPNGKQHTFVETDSVRYVYQPLDKLFMLLITTKASNILEDLETLRLFSRVIPEYCQTVDEAEIVENAFNLIFAFDEIVALGYRESVNLAQVRTFVEMDSHEEKVYQAVRQTQEREAKNKMREKAKELQRQKMEAAKRGIRSPTFGSTGGFGSSSVVSTPVNFDVPEIPKPSYSAPIKSTSSSNKALKLGGKVKDVETFVDQLKSEGENVNVPATGKVPSTVAKVTAMQNTESIHLRIEEKIQLVCGRDGGLQNMEVYGIVTLRITDEKYGQIRVQFENRDNRGIQMQTHPNVDKELFKAKSQIGLKHASKPFPLSTDVGVLKWRFQTKDESAMPLTINCWPSENGQGGCDVNIEYELQDDTMELNDVCIVVPLPPGVGSPVVNECDGDYTHEARKNQLLWQLPLVDASNKTGILEFTSGGLPDDFFPVQVSFVSKKSFAELAVVDVLLVEDDTSAKHSVETVFFTEKYEIV